MAEIDVAPELLERVQEAFAEGVQNNRALSSAAGQINLGRGSFEKAERYAEEVGKELARAFRKVLTESVLPNGRLYYNIADRVVRPMLEEGYLDVQQLTGKLVEQLNSAEGIGLKATYPEPDKERIQGIIDAASSQETVKESLRYLGEPVVNLQQHAVDEMARSNAEFQYQVGTSPKIRRVAEAKCCEWCSGLAGTYEYKKVRNKGNDVYRRHENCRCLVEYIPDKGGKRQNAWSKRWKNDEETASRREYGLQADETNGKITPSERETVAERALERRLPDNEGHFFTYDFRNDPGDHIKPRNIAKDLNRTDAGRNALAVIQEKNINVLLVYGSDAETGKFGDYEDSIIRIYADKTKTVHETALTIIHEAKHAEINRPNTKSQELLCFIEEYKHDGKAITQKVVDDLKTMIDRLYPELDWERGS